MVSLQRPADVVQSSLSGLRAFLRGVSRGTFTQVCQSVLTCPSACARGELRMKSVGAKTSISATASSFSWKRWEDESCLPSAASNFIKFQFHLLPEHRESEWPTEAALQASLRSCNCLQSIKTASEIGLLSSKHITLHDTDLFILFHLHKQCFLS